MKVHPIPRKRNITLQQYDVVSPIRGQKKLRRLPHIFPKVLELPFHSDADVFIEETGDFFRFTVYDTDVEPDVRTHMVRIHPGVTKIVVRSGSGLIGSISDLELDLWRFRLPGSTRPDLATARYVDGDLVVVVPKGDDDDDDDDEGGNEESGNGRVVWDEGSLVLVQ